MRDLGLEHIGHAIGHGPHTLADLRATGKAGLQGDLHVALFIGAYPRLQLHIVFAQHRAAFHSGVDLIAGAVEKARVDEHDALLRGLYARGQIGAGATFFIHHTHLDGVGGKTQQLFNTSEQLYSQSHFFRPVHFGLDHIDAAATRIKARTAHIVHGNQQRNAGIEHGFINGLAIELHRLGGHVMTDIAHQHQAATRQRQRG